MHRRDIGAEKRSERNPVGRGAVDRGTAAQ